MLSAQCRLSMERYQTCPVTLKIALITPIFKGNNENRFENYCPISVLSCFAKLLERLMGERLTRFINKNNILSKHQYGFRKKQIY